MIMRRRSTNFYSPIFTSVNAMPLAIANSLQCSIVIFSADTRLPTTDVTPTCTSSIDSCATAFVIYVMDTMMLHYHSLVTQQIHQFQQTQKTALTFPADVGQTRKLAPHLARTAHFTLPGVAV